MSYERAAQPYENYEGASVSIGQFIKRRRHLLMQDSLKALLRDTSLHQLSDIHAASIILAKNRVLKILQEELKMRREAQ